MFFLVDTFLEECVCVGPCFVALFLAPVVSFGLGGGFVFPRLRRIDSGLGLFPFVLGFDGVCFCDWCAGLESVIFGLGIVLFFNEALCAPR